MSQDKEKPNDNLLPSAKEMQEANATGAGKNEQGQASFNTGSTTSGGSNYGQGSSHLGGESYRQGDKANTGSNYNNETDRLGHSSLGTSNEGSSSPHAGAAQSGNSADQTLKVSDQGGTASRDDNQLSANETRGQQPTEKTPEEGDRRDTSLERDSNVGTDNSTSTRRQDGGSWSQSSTDNS